MTAATEPPVADIATPPPEPERAFTSGAEAVAEIRVMEDRIEAMRESLASAIGAAREAYVADIAAFIQAAACGELQPLETDS